MTTPSSTNSFVRNGNLYITPTLTSDLIGIEALYNGYTYNLTDCTYNQTLPSSSPSSSSSSSGTGNSTNTEKVDEADAEAYYRACGAVSNSSTGAVISPIQSARLSTRKSVSIRYGKVEVRAKLPSGWASFRFYFYWISFCCCCCCCWRWCRDWLWPAIWMLPVQNTYGPWPMSGELPSVIHLLLIYHPLTQISQARST
jgi:hypothetical protein